MKTDNEFGAQTYWNRPTVGRQRKLVSKYATLNLQSTLKSKGEGKVKTQRSSRSPSTKVKSTGSPRRSISPALSHSSSVNTVVSPSRSAHRVAIKSMEEDNDDKDEKSIVKIMKSKLPQFSNESDWEIAIFELSLVLDRVWPHPNELNIIEYMSSLSSHRSTSGDMETRADRLIYFALTTASRKDSFAKLQIMASCHKDAIPCVMKNEGKKLYQMFQTMFSMTNLHEASLPTVRAEFYAIAQKEGESILKYTSRVDVIVATMAKLGERISTGAWIYALGNGLRTEFKVCKKGILYNEDGFGTVMLVKTKLLSEEAVLTSQLKKVSPAPLTSSTTPEDEIALVLKKSKDNKRHTIPKTPTVVMPEATEATPLSSDTALWTTGKGSKGKDKSKGKHQWTAHTPSWNNEWTQWAQPSKGKGRGKGSGSPEQFWCEICSRSGHSTDWCYDNPKRTGGKPLSYEELWCATCNRSGHTSNSCYATSVRITPKGKGKSKGGKGKQGDRNWKSQNFPAGYQSDQATPALHDETPSTETLAWWQDCELGSAIIEGNTNPVPLQPGLLEDYVEFNTFDDDDDEYVTDYIDLVLFAIITNIERQNAYQRNPSNALLQEIIAHSDSITRAENCLNVHIRRIIRNFKSTVNYDACMLGITPDNSVIEIEADISYSSKVETEVEKAVKIKNESIVESSVEKVENKVMEHAVEITNESTIESNVEKVESKITQAIESKVEKVESKAEKAVEITNESTVENEVEKAVEITYGSTVENEVEQAVEITNESNLNESTVKSNDEKAVEIMNGFTIESKVKKAVECKVEKVEGNVEKAVKITNGSTVENEVEQAVEITNESNLNESTVKSNNEKASKL